MPAFNGSPFAPSPALMIGGQPQYLFGGFNDKVAPTKIQITSVAIASNVATVVGTVVSGNAPAVGSPISIQGTSTSSGLFNVTNVALASVTSNQTTGVTTVTFPLTGGNVSTTNDNGSAIVNTPVTFETVANGSSVSVASAENDPSTNDERAYFVQVLFGTLPTACVVTLQGALVNQDSAFENVGVVATVAGSALTVNNTSFPNLNLRFLRVIVSGTSGSGTVAVAVLG